MKKITLLFISFLISTTIVKAQQLKPNTTINLQRASYSTTINQYGVMEFENHKNTLRKKKAKNQRYHMDDNSAFNIVPAFTQIFSRERLKELTQEPGLLVTFYVSPEGKVLEVSYILKPNTSITAAELSDLETAIKSKVFFKLNWETGNKEKADFVTISENVRFSRILDGTQK